MYNFTVLSPQEAFFLIDTTIYPDSVINKTLYWWIDKLIISREMISSSCQKITIKNANSDGTIDFKQFQIRLSQDFIDYRLREIIRKETEAIRNILYIKALAYDTSENDTIDSTP